MKSALTYWCLSTKVRAAMSRLTITLSESRYRALKQAAAQRDKTIGQLIDESLDFYGIKSGDEAQATEALEGSTTGDVIEIAFNPLSESFEVADAAIRRDVTG